jgi:cytochrome c-type biogenesis protein CcmH/NrfF
MSSSRTVGVFLAILILGMACFGTGEDSPRLRALTEKLMCNCGCGEHLEECSHKQCERKPGLRQEIAAAIQQGKTDDQIVNMLADKYGSDILLAPRFRGFDTMLWIVPVVGAFVAVGFTVAMQKRRRERSGDSASS